MAATSLSELIGRVRPQMRLVDALDPGPWLDWLEHRADLAEGVNVAVLLRQIARAATVEPSPYLAEFMVQLRRLKPASGLCEAIERLIVVPGADTSWLPSSADEAVLLDAERSWFGDPAQGYWRRVAAIRALSCAPAEEGRSAQRLENLTRILESGLIFFLPETRCALEGRACLNLSFEVADLRNGPREQDVVFV